MCKRYRDVVVYSFLYIYIEHTTVLLVEMKGAESEVGEHNAGGTTESLG